MRNNLKKIRKQKNLTLKQLGDMSSTSKSRIHDLESQEGSCPTLPKAYNISIALNVSIFDIWPII